MSLPKVFLSVCCVLFGAIALAAAVKHFGGKGQSGGGGPNGTLQAVKSSQTSNTSNPNSSLSLLKQSKRVQEVDLQTLQGQTIREQLAHAPSQGTLPSDLDQNRGEKPEQAFTFDTSATEENGEIDSLLDLFCPGSSCPIVQTIRYSSRVSWKPKRSAWLIDYANHYKTPVDFVLRSLNRGKSAKERPVSEGESFCVLRTDVPFSFLVVVESSSCTMKLYYLLPTNEGLKVQFLKKYEVGLGRKSPEKVSGTLTPYGLFRLGSRVAVFRPGMTGMYKGKKVEQIQVFGTRWIPFEREIADCTEPAKGFGIHGTPWVRTESGQLLDQTSSVGGFESDGCIRMKTQDVEELYAVISSRPGYVEIVPKFSQSKLLSGKLQLP